jgi:YD repeat-containing protein
MHGSERLAVALPVRLGGTGLTITFDSQVQPSPSDPLRVLSYTGQPTAFGELWLSNWHRRLIVAAGFKTALAVRGNGHIASFTGNGAGVFTSEANVNDRLLSVGGGYRYTDASDSSIESYDSTGSITRIDRNDGTSLVFSYSTATTPPAVAPAPGYLLSVADTFGRNVQFEYTLPVGPPAINLGRVSKVIDAAGNAIAVAYDNAGNLSTLTWQDTTTRQFLYENTSLPWALTGVANELAQRHATTGYDAQGRAISTELAGGVNRYVASYTSAPAIIVTDTYNATENVVYRTRSWQAPTGTKVTTPYGTTIDLGVTLAAGQPSVTTRSQPAGSGCAASTSSLGYDANGNVEAEDDFNGNRVCRSHDLARNLESVRVRGLPTTQTCGAVTAANAALPIGSRKTSTQWHPDWRLAVKVAEPGRITTSVYNGQPDPFAANAIASCAPSTALLPDGKPIVVLCKTVEQATTDASGTLGFGAALQSGVANRVQQWTYNQFGQVLTERDALNNTTTYTYHPATTADVTQGDLATMTNAKGQLTNYTKYNRHGQVLQSTDPNGVVTVNTYDLRQRLLSTSVGGQTTSYTYDPAGQLTRMTRPDGSWIGYEYDAAHRQTAVLDNRGNRIDYTLDNAGNKTGQAVKDPGGTLRRTLARSIDALGRIQQTTGRE